MIKWYVVTVLSHRERWVGHELHRSTGLYWYVPLETRSNLLRGRLTERKQPLLPGYLFLCDVAPTVWRDVLETQHVIDCLRSDGDPAPLYQWEIDRIRELEAEHNRAMEDARQPHAWKAGDRARIMEGPFADIQTLLEEIRGSKARFRVPAGSVWVATDALAPVA